MSDLPYAPWLVSRKDAIRKFSAPTTRPFGFIGTWREIKKNGTALQRDPHRDQVCALFAKEELHFYDADVSKSTHGYPYDQSKDGPAEHLAHQKASIYVYFVRDAISAKVASRGLIETSRHKNDKAHPTKSIVWWLEETLDGGKLKPPHEELRKKMCDRASVVHAHSFDDVERHIRDFITPPKKN